MIGRDCSAYCTPEKVILGVKKIVSIHNFFGGILRITCNK